MDTQADRISETEFRRLADSIESQCGLSLSSAKRVMLETRLRKRASALGLHSLGAYCEHIRSAEGRRDEWPNLIDVVTTHKTDFFREPRHFEVLVEQALPELAGCGGAGFRRPLLVWSAACSTGEEPYTLAMVLSGYADSVAPNDYRFRIEATDISGAVLETARAAVYAETSIGPVPEDLRRRFLLRSKDRNTGRVRVAPEIRAYVHFRQLNLMDSSYGFADPFDVVMCRNVMIYFDRRTQERILNRISLTLRQGGYLLMGHSESLNGLDLPLEQVSPTVYRRLNAG